MHPGPYGDALRPTRPGVDPGLRDEGSRRGGALLVSPALHAVRQCALRQGLPGQRRLEAGGRHRHAGHLPLHRLPLLHRRLPLRRAQLQLGRAAAHAGGTGQARRHRVELPAPQGDHREVHFLPGVNQAGETAGVRRRLPDGGDLLRRPGGGRGHQLPGGNRAVLRADQRERGLPLTGRIGHRAARLLPPAAEAHLPRSAGRARARDDGRAPLMPRRPDQFSPRERVLLASLTEAGPGFYALVGVLLSAILRITGAEWRRSVTRMAEAITFASLLMGALMPFVDMGRPDRILNLLLHGRLQSPLLWDIMAITTYLTGSTLFLFVPMIPDIALLRDRFAAGPAWRRRLYTLLALGWKGTEVQRHHLERIMGIMAIIIIPIAVSVHTVVSWIFGMTLRAGWNSTVFGPYFVSGALFSGAAAVVTAMAAFRWAYHLEEYITEAHFRRMGYLVITLGMIYAYFTFAEYITPAYKMATAERGYLTAVFSGQFAPLFWFTQIGGVFLTLLLLTVPRISWVPRLARIPFLRPVPALATIATSVAVLLALPAVLPPTAAPGGFEVLRQLPVWIIGALGGWLFLTLLPVFRQRPIAAAVVASLLVNIAAWLKRFVIIVPTLQFPFLPIQRAPAGWAIYQPTWVELSITAAAVAGFVLIYLLFSKVFPIVSIWETREEGHRPGAALSPAGGHGGVADAPAP